MKSPHHYPRAQYSADALAAAWISKGSASPSNTQTAAYRRFFGELVEAQLWDRFDLLYCLGAANSALALTNMVPEHVFPLTAVNAPTFNADRGYTFNGTTQELTSTWSTSIARKFRQRSHHVSAYTLTDGTSTGFDFGEVTGTICAVKSRAGINSSVRLQNSTGLADLAGGTQPLQVVGTRRDEATTGYTYREGVLSTTASLTPSAPTATAWSVGHAISLFSDRQIFMVSVGDGFKNDLEALNFYNACHNLAVAVGADT